MTNRRLTDEELSTLFAPLLVDVRSRLRALAAEDETLHWALRRKLAKELGYDVGDISAATGSTSPA